MGGNSNHVKQLLATVRLHHRPELLQEVVQELQASEGRTGTTSTELRVLCAEVAVEMQQWPTAALLLRGVGAAHETSLLRIRKQFCDVLVALHDVEAQPNNSEEEVAQAKLQGAATVLEAVADGVQMWPESMDAVLMGVRALWSIISPLYEAGRQAEVCDAVVFLATLHQQLRIGGGHTLIQWMARSALCLYAADRVPEAYASVATALDAAALMANQRLYVQVLRLSAAVICARERAVVATKGRSDFFGSYRGRPVIFGVLLTQLIFTRMIDGEGYRDDLHSIYDTLHGGNVEVVLAADAAATAGKGKKKPPATKQAPLSTRTTEAFAVTDSDVVEEVKSDVLLCIALHDTLSAPQLEELEKRCNSANRRVRSFTAYTLVVQEAQRCGVAQLSACADASVLTAEHRACVVRIAQQLVAVLKGTSAIHDESERQYTQQVGVSLLWNYVLPFLQPGSLAEVQPALDVALELSQAALPQLRSLFLQAGLQQCHTAYVEDQRTTLQHLLPTLQREYARVAGRGGDAQVEFPLQWLQRQVAILDEPESSLTSDQDRCLYALEQARAVSNPLKRIPLLKTAFQHLPPLLREEAAPPEPSSLPTSRAAGSAVQASTPAQRVPPQRRSTVQLYKELLDLCMEDVSPSLYTVAGVVAEALRSLPTRPPNGQTVEVLEEVQAAATMHSATLLWKQLDDGESVALSGRPSAAAASNAKDATAVATRSEAEARLSLLLRETAQQGTSLESRRAGSGAWLVANACVTFLAWKKPAYEAGDYGANVAELLELQSTYASLFLKGRVQDVALLSALATAAVMALLAGYVASKVPPSIPPHGATDGESGGGYANLVRRIQTCTAAEPANAQLRRAEGLCREALQLVAAPKQKWFIATLYPAVLRLLNEKMPVPLHPQEHVLLCLGVLAGPTLAQQERQALLELDVRAALRKDPSVRLCAWVAAFAAELQLEEVVLECCRLADGLYAGGRLGWDSLWEVQRPHPATVGGSGKSVESAAGGGGGGLGATVSGAGGQSNRKGSAAPVLAPREGVVSAKPDAEDWGAYAQLLAMKTRVCASHLQGMTGDVRRIALQQLFTNCVNAAIAATHGPPAAVGAAVVDSYGTYYAILRSHNTFPLTESAFLLPSLRMLLSKALLTQIPKREWGGGLTELVYQLGTVLVYVTYSSGRAEDLQPLAGHLRVLRDVLPPRCQKALKLRETTEVCYKDPSVDSFLQLSRNMEPELQTHGWLIVAQKAKNAAGAAEAFALALAGTQASPLARAQCLFEFAYTTLQRDESVVGQVADQLREALRTLEGLPERVPLLRDGAVDERGFGAALADRSLAASLLRPTPAGAPTRGSSANDALGRAARTASKMSMKRANAPANAQRVTFAHVLLGLRIVSLLFRLAPSAVPSVTGTGAAAAKASKHAPAPTSRRECASVMVDYVLCLWKLCERALIDAARSPSRPASRSAAEPASWSLPGTAAHFYGVVVPAEVVQQVRNAVAGEELQLNTEGVWQQLLELGDFLVRTGDEAHAFVVYGWLCFGAALSLGDAAGSAESALVQRVANLRMCVAATASGRSDAPYVAALQRLDDAHVQLDGLGAAASPEGRQSWVTRFVLAECESRLALGEVEEAAALASRFLAPPPTALTSDDARGEAVDLSDVELGGVRILALREVVRANYDDALRLIDCSLAPMQSHRNAFGAASSFCADTWVKLCVVRLRALLAKKAMVQAVHWVAAVRAQLVEWQAAVASSRSPSTLRVTSLRTSLSDAAEHWTGELLQLASGLHPSATALRLFPSHESPLHDTAVALLEDVVALTETAGTLHAFLYRAAAQWHLRDRVTAAWVAEHADSPREHLCPRLATLVAQTKALQQLCDVLDATPPVRTAANSAVDVSSSLLLWRALLLHWIAVDRLEANRIMECLLVRFRGLSMVDLELPTTAAPPHLEREVLKFIRGVTGAESAAEPPVDGGAATSSKTAALPAKVGARWHAAAPSAMSEVEQALQHYGLPTQDARIVADVAAVPQLLQQAVEVSRRWWHSRLACGILVAHAEVAVQRHAENQIAVADGMLGERLDRQRESVLTAAWNRNPLVSPKTDKTGPKVRKSVSNGKQRASIEMSRTLGAPPLAAEDEALLTCIQTGAEEAVLHVHLDVAEVLYDHLSSLAILLGRPQLAAAAAEQMQACQLVGLLAAKSTKEMIDSAEGRLWRQLAVVSGALRGASSCRGLLDAVMAHSPLGRPIRSCSAVLLDDNADEEAPLRSAHARETAGGEAPSYATDAPVLTIALSSSHADFCLVLLRHPDGAVEGRRRAVAEAEWQALVGQCDALQSQRMEVLGTAAAGRLDSSSQRLAAEDAAAVTDPLSAIASKLLADFQPSMQSYCVKAPLYLCLAPCVQALAWEQAAVLSACSVVIRELGAAVVMTKFNEPMRAARRPSTRGSKPAGPSAPKHVTTGPSVCLVDPFGDHSSGSETPFSAEAAKAKATQQVLITCSSPGTAPDPEYLSWVLSASSPSSLVVDMCGSLADCLPLSHLASLRLTPVNVAVLADGAVNAQSRQREERQRLGAGAVAAAGAPFVPPRWLVQLLVLLRGARLVVGNTFPCSPDVADALARRCLSSLSSAKALVEQLKGRGKDSKTPLVTLYGAMGNSAKQKA